MIPIFILVLIPVLVVAAATSIAFFALRRSMQAELNELRTVLYQHVQSTSEKPAAQPEKKAPAPEVAKPAPAPAPKPAPVAPAPVAASDEVSPEILAVIAAAVAHFCGVHARIRGARLVPQTGTSAWAQWGRASVQASHNLSAQRARV